jgi:plasmid stability protein
MAQLIVRNIEDEVAQKLKERAAKNGVSAEEEHRRILAAVLNNKEADGESKMTFEEFLVYGEPFIDVDLKIERDKSPMREIDFSD